MAKLSYQQRKKMPKKSFAFPSKKTSSNQAGKGAYPIPDANHARNALARGSKWLSPADYAKLKGIVHRKFPSIGKG